MLNALYSNSLCYICYITYLIVKYWKRQIFTNIIKLTNILHLNFITKITSTQNYFYILIPITKRDDKCITIQFIQCIFIDIHFCKATTPLRQKDQRASYIYSNFGQKTKRKGKALSFIQFHLCRGSYSKGKRYARYHVFYFSTCACYFFRTNILMHFLQWEYFRARNV